MEVNILFIGIQNSDYLHDHHSPSKSMNPPSPFSTYFQQKIKIDNKQLQFKLWNPAGQEQYKKLRQLSFYEMDAIIIAFLITESNLSLVKSYYQQIRSKQAKRLHNIYLLPKQYQNPSQVEQTLKSHSIPSMLDHSTYIILEESALFEKIARKYIEQQNQLKIRQSQCCIIY